MSKELEINTEFFANRGVIGRRDYVLNIIYLSIAGSILTIPMTLWISKNVTSYNDLINLGNILLKASPIALLGFLLACALDVVIKISNGKRRITDICGNENDTLKYLYGTLVVAADFAWIVSSSTWYILCFISTIINLFLIFKKGKITSLLAYDVTKDFNFGAFFGGVLWGLFNGVYQTLWLLILAFTPFSGAFIMICGLKGNEWALKAKNYDSIEEFNKKQKKQAVVFFIICSILPALFITTIYASIFGYIMKQFKGGTHKDTQQIIEKVEKQLSASLFKKYEIREEINRFYIEKEVWAKTNLSEKTKIMGFAAQISANYKNENIYKLQNKKTYKAFELNKTKIYIYETNQLVGEYYLNEDVYKMDIQQALKEGMKAYKFYTFI